MEKETREGMYEAFSKLGESFFSIEGVKKAAAWYIDTTERVATQALELQEKATGWAKETPLASIFEAQQVPHGAVGRLEPRRDFGTPQGIRVGQLFAQSWRDIGDYPQVAGPPAVNRGI